MNSLFSLLHKKDQHEDHYNFIVDQIVQLSHAYKPCKDPSDRKQSGHTKIPSLEPAPLKRARIEARFERPDFSSFKDAEEEEEEDMKSLSVGENEPAGEGRYMSSFLKDSFNLNFSLPSVNLQHNHSVAIDQEDEEYIEVGLGHGDSAELVVMGEGYATSMLMTLNRRVSSES
jgi:hypothetical protein